jgi:hypothetical protein
MSCQTLESSRRQGTHKLLANPVNRQQVDDILDDVDVLTAIRADLLEGLALQKHLCLFNEVLDPSVANGDLLSDRTLLLLDSLEGAILAIALMVPSQLPMLDS